MTFCDYFTLFYHKSSFSLFAYCIWRCPKHFSQIRHDSSTSLPLRTLGCQELLFLTVDEGINPLGRVILVLSTRKSAYDTEKY